VRDAASRPRPRGIRSRLTAYSLPGPAPTLAVWLDVACAGSSLQPARPSSRPPPPSPMCALPTRRRSRRLDQLWRCCFSCSCRTTTGLPTNHGGLSEPRARRARRAHRRPAARFLRAQVSALRESRACPTCQAVHTQHAGKLFCARLPGRVRGGGLAVSRRSRPRPAAPHRHPTSSPSRPAAVPTAAAANLAGIPSVPLPAGMNRRAPRSPDHIMAPPAPTRSSLRVAYTLEQAAPEPRAGARSRAGLNSTPRAPEPPTSRRAASPPRAVPGLSAPGSGLSPFLARAVRQRHSG